MRAAARWYYACQSGLGTRFLREIARTGKRIASHSEAWPIVSGKVCRCLVDCFPFGLLYRVEGEKVYILAVMHQKREPDYWKNRMI